MGKEQNDENINYNKTLRAGGMPAGNEINPGGL
jgi:hypothetical protein